MAILYCEGRFNNNIVCCDITTNITLSAITHTTVTKLSYRL